MIVPFPLEHKNVIGVGSTYHTGDLFDFAKAAKDSRPKYLVHNCSLVIGQGSL